MWVARNKDESLHIFNYKPTRNSEDNWVSKEDVDNHYGYLVINEEDMFEDLTWEDEPIKVFRKRNNLQYICEFFFGDFWHWLGLILFIVILVNEIWKAMV